MARIPVYMPKFGMTMTAAIILEWHCAVGDQVAAGDALLSIETEKTNIAVPAPAAGTVAAICFPADEEVAVGSVLAYLDAHEEG